MISKKHFVYIVIVVLSTFSITLFIKKSNDHIECNTVMKKTLSTEGIEVVTKEHKCNEKYSF